MMKIAFFEVQDWEKEYLQNKLQNVSAVFFQEPLTGENVGKVKDVDMISCFLDSDLHEAVLSQFTHLKMISTRSTGFDHIDMEFCKAHGIIVCNVPTYGENTVAEHTFALILDLARKIYQGIERTKRGDFSSQGLQGWDLKGKTIGIVGMGHIGQHVARIANGFEMNVLGFDTKPDKKLAKILHIKYVEFNDLLKNSDIITLHVPYNGYTRHLINSNNIALIKHGAYLINTARGAIVETEALVGALQIGILAGAGLDVLEEEGFIKEEGHFLSKNYFQSHDIKTILEDHILLQQKNVIITPHNAFNSQEALERILETTVLSIQSFLKKKPLNIVI